MHYTALYSDVLFYTVIAGSIGFFWRAYQKTNFRSAIQQLLFHKLTKLTLLVMGLFLSIALIDSLHFQMPSGQTKSLLDLSLNSLATHTETSYSAPFATVAFSKQTVLTKTGEVTQVYPALKYPGQHWLGTNKVGQDVLYASVKSIRTGVLIGLLTTFVMLPFALFFGLSAGFFGGWVDDVIQYIYTTLSAIPGVLLIAAAVLSLQLTVETHPQWFQSLLARADIRLVGLCLILGITSWTSLCRLLRGETLKLREQDYVMAAKTLGLTSFQIIRRHILPNVMHIVIITVALDFSGLVLAEAVLSYVGIGVDPTMMSWGNMINGARLELAREPIVWWPLLSAFVFMFVLVLSANIFADKLRDAFDPRIQ